MRVPSHVLQDIKQRIPISQIVGRRVAWDKKKSRPARGDYWACCPAHGEKTPSFHADDRRGQYHCFGCGFSGDHYRFLTDYEGMSFSEAIQELAGLAGVTLDDAAALTPAQEAERAQRAAERQQEYARQRTEQLQKQAETEEDIRRGAYKRWCERLSIKGTCAEAYLRGRGIPVDETFYKTVGYHPALPYPEEYGGGKYAAIMGAVQSYDMRFMGLWRIYLDGKGDKAPVEYPKLGYGACSGGAVWLGAPGRKIHTVEGLETGLSVRCLINYREPVAVCLSTWGLESFIPPIEVEHVHNWPDNDIDRMVEKNGREHRTEAPGVRASRVHVEKMKARGLKADAEPSWPNGLDYNDALKHVQRILHGPVRSHATNVQPFGAEVGRAMAI